jgi:WD40 repeat protein
MVRLSADGRWAISDDYDGRVCLWDVRTGESVANVRVFKRNLTALAFHPDGATAAVSDLSGGTLPLALPDRTEIGHRCLPTAPPWQ